VEYEQFEVKDDEELKKEREVAANKGKKQPKNNSHLDSFLSKRGAKESKPPKSEKPVQVQLTLE
jgi:hypothetical protein